MAKNAAAVKGQGQEQGQGHLIPPQGQGPENKRKAKIAQIEKFKIEEADSLRRGLQNMRDLVNNMVGVTIGVLDAHRRFHYLPETGGPARTNEQDKRIQERATVDWNRSVTGALAIIQHLEEEIRAAKSALEG